MTAEQRPPFEAEALAAVERALGSVRATQKALDQAANALLLGSAAGYRDLEKVRELQRLAGVRLEAFARRMGEGVLVDSTDWGTP